MRAYYIDNLSGDQRLPLDYLPFCPVSMDTLKAIGIRFWSIPVDDHEAKTDEIKGIVLRKLSVIFLYRYNMFSPKRTT